MAYYTIKRLAKARGIKGRTVTLPEIEIPESVERELFLVYDKVVRKWWAEAREQILPAYVRAVTIEREVEKRKAAIQRDEQTVLILDSVKEGSQKIDEATSLIERLVLTLAAEVSEWALGVERYHRDKFVGNVYTATSVQLNTILHPSDVRTTLEAVLEANMGLIRNVSEDTRRRISEIFFRNYKLRTPLRQVAKEIAEAVGISRRRALLIASDQTTKLAAALDEERMREAGIDEWEWVHSGKKHFRPEHKARDGKIYNWRTARSRLKGDLPGVAINCGCKAKAIIRF